jgi:OOP family OmpA-OmpF porin
MASSATKRLKELNKQAGTARSATRPPARFRVNRGDDEVAVSWINFIMVAAIGFGLLLAAAIFFGTRSIEGTLEAKAIAVLESNGFDAVDVVAVGTDLHLRGTYYLGDPIGDAIVAVGAISGVGSVESSQLYDVARPAEVVAGTPTGSPINVAWEGASVIVSGDISSGDLRTSLIQALSRAGGVAEVDDAALQVVDGIPSEAVWIDEMAALVAQAIAGLDEGSFFVNPSGRIFKVSGVTESRQLKSDIETTAEVAADASGFFFTTGVIIPKVEDAPTEEEVEELQSNLDDLIDGKVVEFQGGSADLSATGMALLDEILQALQANLNVPVTIHGHASSEGSSTVNLKLSEDRAAAVRDYLVARGADPNRFIVIGHGDTQPVASNSTEEGRARNRRIEFEALLEELTAEEEP